MARMLSIKEVTELLGVSKATLWRLRASGSFPPSRQISAGRVGWLSDDVGKWMEAR